jgi:hypothetical protein
MRCDPLGSPVRTRPDEQANSARTRGGQRVGQGKDLHRLQRSGRAETQAPDARTSIQPCQQSPPPETADSDGSRPSQLAPGAQGRTVNVLPPTWRKAAITNKSRTRGRHSSWLHNRSCCACRWSCGSLGWPGQRSTSSFRRTSSRCRSSCPREQSPGCSPRSRPGCRRACARIEPRQKPTRIEPPPSVHGPLAASCAQDPMEARQVTVVRPAPTETLRARPLPQTCLIEVLGSPTSKDRPGPMTRCSASSGCERCCSLSGIPKKSGKNLATPREPQNHLAPHHSLSC